MEANHFTVLWWFLPCTGMNQPWVHMCPLHPPPPAPSHPSGWSQCTSLECPVPCINLGLLIFVTYVIYMFQCYSLSKSLIYFCSDLYAFFPSANFGFCLFPLSLVAVSVRLGCLRLFPEVSLYRYELSS